MSLPLVTGHVSLAASRLRLPGGATQLSGVATVGCTPLPGRAEEVGSAGCLGPGVGSRSQGSASVPCTCSLNPQLSSFKTLPARLEQGAPVGTAAHTWNLG